MNPLQYKNIVIIVDGMVLPMFFPFLLTAILPVLVQIKISIQSLTSFLIRRGVIERDTEIYAEIDAH